MMLHPNNNPEFFVVFEAKALRKFVGCNVRNGQKIYGHLVPNGKYYLSKSGFVGGHLGRVFETDAIENVDFVRV